MKHQKGLNEKLIQEWHPTKNGNLDPHNISPYSNKKAWWKCEKDHEWPAFIHNRTSGKNCPYCSDRFVCKDNNLAIISPEIAMQWNVIKNNTLTPYDVTSQSNRKVWWKCEKGHEWPAKINNRYNGKGCPYCYGRFASEENNLLIKYPELSKEWHPIKNGNLNPQNVGPHSEKKVWWKCEKGHEWPAFINNRSKGKGCPYCSGSLPSKEYNLAILYPEIIKLWNQTKNNTLTPYDVVPHSHKKVWWICQNGHEWPTEISHIANGSGCPHCSTRISKKGTKWLDSLNIKNREFKIKIENKTFIVDGFDIDNKIIYEYLGDHWHGNPNTKNMNDINLNVKVSYGELFRKTVERFNILYKAGYKIIYKWESSNQEEIFVLNFNFNVINVNGSDNVAEPISS